MARSNAGCTTGTRFVTLTKSSKAAFPLGAEVVGDPPGIGDIILRLEMAVGPIPGNLPDLQARNDQGGIVGEFGLELFGAVDPIRLIGKNVMGEVDEDKRRVGGLL